MKIKWIKNNAVHGTTKTKLNPRQTMATNEEEIRMKLFCFFKVDPGACMGFKYCQGHVSQMKRNEVATLSQHISKPNVPHCTGCTFWDGSRMQTLHVCCNLSLEDVSWASLGAWLIEKGPFAHYPLIVNIYQLGGFCFCKWLSGPTRKSITFWSLGQLLNANLSGKTTHPKDFKLEFI